MVRVKYGAFHGLKVSQRKPVRAAHPHRLAVSPASELRTLGRHYLLQVKQRPCLFLAYTSADFLPQQLPGYPGNASRRPGASEICQNPLPGKCSKGIPLHLLPTPDNLLHAMQHSDLSDEEFTARTGALGMCLESVGVPKPEELAVIPEPVLPDLMCDAIYNQERTVEQCSAGDQAETSSGGRCTGDA